MINNSLSFESICTVRCDAISCCPLVGCLVDDCFIYLIVLCTALQINYTNDSSTYDSSHELFCLFEDLKHLEKIQIDTQYLQCFQKFLCPIIL